MSKELEIEFKNLLQEKEYLKLLEVYGFTAGDAKTQVNHYFDTPDFRLKDRLSALRVRQKDDSWECTLKIPAEQGNYEITDKLDGKQAKDIIYGVSFDAPEVLEALEKLEISPNDLRLIGSLTTHRIEFAFKGGLLVLDHSEYCGLRDFEVEYEVQDADIGKQHFKDFLAQYDIPERHADKKIARFMKAAETLP